MSAAEPPSAPARLEPTPDAKAGFRDELRAQNLPLLLWTSVVFNSVVLAWSFFDWLLAREHFWQFLALRVAGVATNSALVVALHRPRWRSFSHEGFVLWVFFTGAAIAAMLCQVREAFLAYCLGYALVLLAAGVLPLWSPRWALGAVLLSLFTTTTAVLVFRPLASTRDLITGTFFVATIAAGSPLIAWLKYVLAQRAWFMLQQLREEQSISTRLRDLDRLKDEFLANVSHELRTPLNGIIGLSDSMAEEGDRSPEGLRQNLRMISASGRRLATLVNDILDFAKLRNQDLPLHPRPVDLKSAVDVALTLLLPQIQGKALRLENAIPAALPPAWVDENRLSQVLMNLAGNAVKFTEKGSVEVSAKAVGGAIQVAVKDTGIGIAADKQQLIFESFVQADASIARNYGGTGLGLAITKKLVEAMGGALWVQSRLGEGSVFSFSVPASAEPLPAGAAVPQVLAARTPKPGTPSPAPAAPSAFSAFESASPAPLIQVLAVDDEPINLQVLENYLSPKTYQVTRAGSGAEALALLQSGYRPHVVLLDVMMPRMSGYEMLREVRRRFDASDLPVILLTAKNLETDLVAGFEAGANDYLTKPILKGELLSRLKTHLYLARLFEAYGRFVPHDLIRQLEHESILEVKLGDQVLKEMSVLFSDIRSFTSLSESMTPRENFNFLNSFLRRVAPVIGQHNGFIDSYIGDATMSLFPGAVEDAVSAAAALRQEVRRYNEHRMASGYRPIALGTGLHTGPLILGTIGYEQRMQTTVIADTVNQASRLEGLTKFFGLEVVLSEEVISRLRSAAQFDVRSLGKMRIRGKQQSVVVYELLSGATPKERDLKLRTLERFSAGVEALGRGDLAAARSAFEVVRLLDPSDTAAQRLLERAEQHLSHPELNAPEVDALERRK